MQPPEEERGQAESGSSQRRANWLFGVVIALAFLVWFCVRHGGNEEGRYGHEAPTPPQPKLAAFHSTDIAESPLLLEMLGGAYEFHYEPRLSDSSWLPKLAGSRPLVVNFTTRRVTGANVNPTAIVFVGAYTKIWEQQVGEFSLSHPDMRHYRHEPRQWTTDVAVLNSVTPVIVIGREEPEALRPGWPQPSRSLNLEPPEAEMAAYRQRLAP